MDHDHSMHGHVHHDTIVSTVPSIPELSTAMDHSMHDHSAHAGHAGHDSPAHQMVHHMMQMAFHGGCTETILFEQWSIDSVSGLLLSMLAIFIMAICYEGLKYYREHLFWRTYNGLQYRPVTVNDKNGTNSNGNGSVLTSSPSNPEEGSSRAVHMVGEVIHKQPPSMFSCMHLYQSLLHLVQVTLSFLLMLIFMTYNTYLCIAVVVGAAVGYFLFGWKKSVIVDVTEHCH